MTTTTASADFSAPADQRHGYRFGLLLMGAFTMSWMSNAANSGSTLLAAAGGLGIAAAALLFVGWFEAGRRACTDSAPIASSVVQRERAARARGRFWFAVAAEVLAMAAVTALLSRTHPETIMPAVALVVALHFLLVYRAYPHPVHVVAALVGSGVAVTGIALALDGVDPALVRGLVGLGMGGITLGYGVFFARALGFGGARA